MESKVSKPDGGPISSKAAERVMAADIFLKNSLETSENHNCDMGEMKRAIKAFFEEHHGESIDYIDLTEAFGYALPDLVTACDELVREGKIAELD